jgi:protein-S-isoprenylcysteine O-methyltransferase Ste14
VDQEQVFRAWLAIILVLSVGISGYHRDRARRSGEAIARSNESGPLILARITITLPLLASIIAWLIHPATMAWSQFDAPLWLRGTGAILGAVAVPLVYWVVSTLGNNISETVLTKRDHNLVTRGPYRWIRHPLYAVGILLLAAAALLMASWVVVALTLLALLGIRFVVIPREEAALVAKFGNQYIEYRARTGRLLPIPAFLP